VFHGGLGLSKRCVCAEIWALQGSANGSTELDGQLRALHDR
jgi:hypothetical protein